MGLFDDELYEGFDTDCWFDEMEQEEQEYRKMQRREDDGYDNGEDEGFFDED